MFDESSGLPYYYHTKTGETVWERPNTFVIPLGVLQNTALTRRLSLTTRVPQRDSKNGQKHASGTPNGTPERAPYRRSRSYLNEREATGQSHKNGSGTVQPRRSQSSTRNSPGRTQHSPPSPTSSSPRPGSAGKRGTSGRKSASSTDHLHHSSGSQGGPLSYDRGHPLAPIPGSPYNTDASPSPAPSIHDKVSVPGTPVNRQRNDAVKKDSPHQKSKTDDNTLGRSRSKSSSYMEYRSPQPQSLSAALEMIALSNSQSSGSQDKSSVSESGHGLRTSTPLQDSPPRVRINTDPKMLSGVSLGDSLHTPETPLRFKFKVGKDKSVPPSPSRPIPAAPQPRRSVSGPVAVQLRGREISTPVLNPGTSVDILHSNLHSPSTVRGQSTHEPACQSERRHANTH